MAVTLESPRWISATRVRISWTMDGATAYVRRDGARIYRGPETSLAITVEPGESPTVWVSDEGWGDDDAHYPTRAQLSFFVDESSDDVESIRVQEYAGGEWVTRKTIAPDGRAWYLWESDYLADETEYLWRVQLVGANGNTTETESLVLFLVHYPEAPDVGFTYSPGTNEVTIT